MNTTSDISIKLPEQAFLTFDDTLSVSNKDLSPRKLQTIMSQSENLKAKADFVEYTLLQRQRYKQKLIEHIHEIELTDLCTEEDPMVQKLNMLTENCQKYDKLAMTEQIQFDILTNMVKREIENKRKLEKLNEDCKRELESTEELGNNASVIDTDKMKQNQMNINAEHDAIKAEYAKKIESGKQLIAKYQKEVIESVNNLKILVQEHSYSYEKKIRLMKTVKRLKEQAENAVVLTEKLKKYLEIYKEQYSKYKEKFGSASRKDIIAQRNEAEIKQQTESNSHNEKIERLNKLTRKYYLLKEELSEIKAKYDKNSKQIQKQKMYDIGEYNPHALSKQYVEKSGILKNLITALEEKIDISRQTVGGIKHMLFRLYKYDKSFEMGPWKNLEVLAAVDDINLAETRAKFSELLLVLEEKIKIFVNLTMQRVSYMRDKKKEPDKNSVDDDVLISIVLSPDTVNSCVDLLDAYMKLRVISPTGLLRSRQSMYITNLELKNQIGIPIPKLIDHKKDPRKNSSSQNESQNESINEQHNEHASNAPGMLSVPKRRILDQNGLDQDFDLLSLAGNMQEMFSKAKNRVSYNNSGVITPENNEYKSERTEISKKFFTARVKKKLEITRGNLSQNERAESSLKKKRRVNHLTIRIEEEMANKPHEIAEIAACTFDELNRFKRATPDNRGYTPRTRKERDLLQKSMPNFVSAVVNMKKSKRGEKIERIATKCRFFPIGSQEKYDLSNPTSPKSRNFELNRRLGQLKSLKQMERLPPRHTAFDEFWKTEDTLPEDNAAKASNNKNNVCIKTGILPAKPQESSQFSRRRKSAVNKTQNEFSKRVRSREGYEKQNMNFTQAMTSFELPKTQYYFESGQVKTGFKRREEIFTKPQLQKYGQTRTRNIIVMKPGKTVTFSNNIIVVNEEN